MSCSSSSSSKKTSKNRNSSGSEMDGDDIGESGDEGRKG
jgi:hypothetical protein